MNIIINILLQLLAIVGITVIIICIAALGVLVFAILIENLRAHWRK